jgi:anti-sigma factor RsiW
VTCEEIGNLLSPYADGELDLVRALEVERHLESCPACAAALERVHSLSARLGDGALYYQPPADLRGRVRASLGRAAGGRGRLAVLPWRWIGAAAAAAALVAVALWGTIRAVSVPSAEELLAREVVAAHVRSTLVDSHLVDRESSNQHVVKPWFIGKVDFAPEVKDLSAEGFPLRGGRLDYIDGQNTAVLVYERGQHVINVFVWRAAGKDTTPEYLKRQGYHLIRWTAGGRAFWVVSELNETELREFVELLRR